MLLEMCHQLSSTSSICSKSHGCTFILVICMQWKPIYTYSVHNTYTAWKPISSQPPRLSYIMRILFACTHSTLNVVLFCIRHVNVLLSKKIIRLKKKHICIDLFTGKTIQLFRLSFIARCSASKRRNRPPPPPPHTHIGLRSL